MKEIEKKIRNDIDNDVKKIMDDPEPTPEDLYSDVGVGKHYIRGVEYELSKMEY